MTRRSIYERIMSRESENGVEAVGPPSSADRRRRWTRTISLLAAGGLLLVAGIYTGAHHRQMLAMFGIAAGADAGAADTRTAEDAQDSDDAAGEKAREATPFVRHASEAGAATCASMFAALGNMLTAGSSYSVQSFWNQEAPDVHAIQALVGMSYETEGYSGPAAGYVVAAPDGAACEGSMVRIAPYSVSCEDVASILPEDSEHINVLREVAVFNLAGGGQALLLPMDASCVVVSVASGTHSSADREGGRE